MPNDSSIRAFKCPTCGAPLEPQAGALTMKCNYCGGTVIIPQSMRTPAPGSSSSVPQYQWGGLNLTEIMGEAMRLPEAISLAEQGTDHRSRSVIQPDYRHVARGRHNGHQPNRRGPSCGFDSGTNRNAMGTVASRLYRFQPNELSTSSLDHFQRAVHPLQTSRAALTWAIGSVPNFPSLSS